MRFSLKPKLFSVRILTLIRCVELTKIKKHWIKRKLLVQESMTVPTDQTKKVKHLSLDLLSFDKGIHKNRFTNAQRIIIREK